MNLVACTNTNIKFHPAGIKFHPKISPYMAISGVVRVGGGGWGGCEVREKACTISLQLKYATVKRVKFINTHENVVQSICMCHAIAAVCKYLI